jgi:two-component system cell cycle response regulator
MQNRSNESGRILVVDDDALSRESLSEVLCDAGYQVRSAKDGTSALEVMQGFVPDLVISDLSMPHMGGYGLVRCIREGSQAPEVPVILISSHDDTQSRVHGFEFGADDFMAKPLELDELLARVSRHLSRSKQERETARLSVSDELTGMLNRRGIHNFFARAQRECQDRKQPMSVLLVDFTRFKSINDKYGHAVGDLALCATARALQDAVRASDRVARIGGDEFLLIMPGMDERACAQLEARLKERLPIRLHLTDDDQVMIGFAVGSATGDAVESLTALAARADAAMYAHKRAAQAQAAGAEPTTHA